MKNLSSASKQEQETFFSSFDQVLCDIDEILSLPVAKQAIQSLEKLNKTIIYISNNSTKSPETYQNQLKSAGFDPIKSTILTPSTAIISYLKKRNFSQEIYLIGMTPLRRELEKAGFKVAEFGPEDFGDSVARFIVSSVEENDKIGAVVVDFDVNLTILKLQRATTCLRKPDMIFIAGSGDKKIVLDNKSEVNLIGPGYFQNILEDMTGRKAVQLAKASDFIKDPTRVLVIGNLVQTDMGFAYKKHLVFEKDYLNLEGYYVDSLEILNDLLNEL